MTASSLRGFQLRHAVHLDYLSPFFLLTPLIPHHSNTPQTVYHLPHTRPVCLSNQHLSLILSTETVFINNTLLPISFPLSSVRRPPSHFPRHRPHTLPGLLLPYPLTFAQQPWRQRIKLLSLRSLSIFPSASFWMGTHSV